LSASDSAAIGPAAPYSGLSDDGNAWPPSAKSGSVPQECRNGDEAKQLGARCRSDLGVAVSAQRMRGWQQSNRAAWNDPQL